MTIHLRRDLNNRPTADLNPGQILDHSYDFMNVVGAPIQHVFLVTVLKAGAAGDIACYRAATLDLKQETLQLVAREGSKITQREAEQLWSDLRSFGRYRP